MIIVVSDTSPVRSLANLGRIDLLRALFTEVLVPPAVERELRSPPSGQVVRVEEQPFIRVQAASDRRAVRQLLGDLDEGESEAIALCLELGSDHLLLIDEVAGRDVARQAGLNTVGVLGVLLEAKHRGFLRVLAPLLDQLMNDYRFFISARVRSDVLRSAGELP